MSCDYEIRCKTCDACHPFNDANHQDDLMRSLVNHAALIASLAPLFSDSAAASASIELRVWCGGIDPSWFAEHAANELAVFDEYGKEDGTCGVRHDCGSCGTYRYCNLAKGHGGEHGRVK